MTFDHKSLMKQTFGHKTLKTKCLKLKYLK